jgi:uncharacterized membrane protein
VSERETNPAEWQNADNWSGPRWLSVYFSKRDTRLVVPKQLPWTGGTLNLGHPAGVICLVLVILLLAVVPLVVAITVMAH